MFQEIWLFLSQHCALKAGKTISVRFGLPNADDRCSINFEQFRRFVETSPRVLAFVTTHLWPFDALTASFEVGEKLIVRASKAVMETTFIFWGCSIDRLGANFLEAMAMYYWGSQPPNNSGDVGKQIFGECKTIIPPIVTLVLGHYFGKADQGRRSPADRSETAP
jgi:hypothetical protein